MLKNLERPTLSALGVHDKQKRFTLNTDVIVAYVSVV